MNDIALSIVIVNYNGGALVGRCIDSVYAHPPQCFFEIVLFDNGSTDGSCDQAKHLFPDVRVRRSPCNIGLARAFNLALTEAQGRFVLSLDSDTRVLPEAIDLLVRRMAASPKLGIAGAALLNLDLTPQKTARRAPTALSALFGRRSLLTRLFPDNRISRRYLMDDMLSRLTPYEVDWVSTAALLFRREVAERIGPLDERFFVYWVDADWCARARKAGWTIEAIPAARVIHEENLKSGRRARRRTRMIVDFHRGAYRYYRKHHVRHVLGPRHLVALVALAVRAAACVAWDYLAGAVNRSRAPHARETSASS